MGGRGERRSPEQRSARGDRALCRSTWTGSGAGGLVGRTRGGRSPRQSPPDTRERLPSWRQDRNAPIAACPSVGSCGCGVAIGRCVLRRQFHVRRRSRIHTGCLVCVGQSIPSGSALATLSGSQPGKAACQRTGGPDASTPASGACPPGGCRSVRGPASCPRRLPFGRAGPSPHARERCWSGPSVWWCPVRGKSRRGWC